MPDEPRRQRTLPSWLLPTPARRDERAGPPLREFTLRLMRGEDLRREEAASLLDALLDGTATDAQIGAALVALAVKGETVEELAGLASSMRGRAVRINARHGCFVDTAGTGSSAAKTFNVSTPPEVSEVCLNELGVCFMFAPLYHGATARVAGVRRELGLHTTFNLLGPLTNPAGAP